MKCPTTNCSQQLRVVSNHKHLTPNPNPNPQPADELS